MIDMCGSTFSITSTDSIPGMSYIIRLKENGTSGHLTPANVDYVDWSQWGGLWRAGGDGIVSPWNSHIGGEIFEPDSKFPQPSYLLHACCDELLPKCKEIEVLVAEEILIFVRQVLIS